MLSGIVGCTFLAASAVSAADLSMYTKAPDATFAPAPAVDAFNGKVESYGGSIDGKSMYGATGSFTVPLSGQFGAQIDGNVGSLDGDTIGSVAGHWFWRDPSRALLGVYAGTTF